MPVRAGREDAQGQFHQIREAWRAASRATRPELETPLRAFLAEYPKEDATRLIRAYLAWVLVEQERTAEAAPIADDLVRGPPGVVRDMAQLTEAALARKHGRAQEALLLLRRLRGKVIDSVQRFLVSEELVLSALDAELYAEALDGIPTWIADASVLHQEAVRKTALEQLQRVPERFLVRAIGETTVRRSEINKERDVQRAWLVQQIREMLIVRAVEGGDAELARSVLSSSPVSIADHEHSAALVKLARGGQSLTESARPVLGLALSSAVSPQHSAEAAAAISVTLQLSRGKPEARAFHSKSTTAPNSNPSPPSLAAFSLAISEDAGQLDRTLEELANAGASLIVTGFTQRDADLATDYAERAQIPVLLMTAATRNSRFAFNLGQSPENERRALIAAAPGETEFRWVESSNCALGAERELANRVAEWKLAQVTTLLFTAETACARDVLRELQAQDFSPHCAFGLDSSLLATEQASPKPRYLKSHLFPLRPRETNSAGGLAPIQASSSDEFRETLGHDPNWFEALGHDATRIAEQLFKSAAPEASPAQDLAALRAQVLVRLQTLAFHDLWTSRDGRFDKAHQLTRELNLVPP